MIPFLSMFRRFYMAAFCACMTGPLPAPELTMVRTLRVEQASEIGGVMIGTHVLVRVQAYEVTVCDATAYDYSTWRCVTCPMPAASDYCTSLGFDVDGDGDIDLGDYSQMVDRLIGESWIGRSP